MVTQCRYNPNMRMNITDFLNVPIAFCQKVTPNGNYYNIKIKSGRSTSIFDILEGNELNKIKVVISFAITSKSCQYENKMEEDERKSRLNNG